MKTIKIGTKIGAFLGFLTFLVFGIVPAFYFGSYGTLIILSHLAGGSVEPTVIVRMITVVGILVGLFCSGTVSIVLGSIFGTALGYIISLFETKAVIQEGTVYEK